MFIFKAKNETLGAVIIPSSMVDFVVESKSNDVPPILVNKIVRMDGMEFTYDGMDSEIKSAIKTQFVFVKVANDTNDYYINASKIIGIYGKSHDGNSVMVFDFICGNVTKTIVTSYEFTEENINRMAVRICSYQKDNDTYAKLYASRAGVSLG